LSHFVGSAWRRVNEKKHSEIFKKEIPSNPLYEAGVGIVRGQFENF
jgi:hypothetical protein